MPRPLTYDIVTNCDGRRWLIFGGFLRARGDDTVPSFIGGRGISLGGRVLVTCC